MARRRRRGLSGVIALALLTAACSAAAEPAPTSLSTGSTPAEPTTTTSTAPAATSPTTAPDSTTTTATSIPEEDLPDLGAEIRLPQGDGPFPAVVLAHGGGWVGGDIGLMRELGAFLNEQGFMTVNTPYALSADAPGFPTAIEDVACAVNLARAHPDSNGTVAIIGHSAGAHLSAVVSLTGDDYVQGCEVAGSGIPDKLVGLAGPYDVSRLGLLMLPFFGSGPSGNPDAWEAGNPQLLTKSNPDLESLIMYGDRDGLVDDSFAIAFHGALEDSGHETLLELVEGARHMDMRDSEWVGDLIVAWLDR